MIINIHLKKNGYNTNLLLKCYKLAKNNPEYIFNIKKFNQFDKKLTSKQYIDWFNTCLNEKITSKQLNTNYYNKNYSGEYFSKMCLFQRYINSNVIIDYIPIIENKKLKQFKNNRRYRINFNYEI